MTSSNTHNARLRVTYAIGAATQSAALERAQAIALEQTVEIPSDILPAGFIADEVVGRVESIAANGPNSWAVVISYRADCAGEELPQWINLMFGNSSLQSKLRVVSLELDDFTNKTFSGPRFGISGIRQIVKRAHGPLICAVIKPMGLSSAALAELAYKMALGGVDIVKDDHGIANQRFARYEERVAACVAAIVRANRQTGGSTIFAANVTAPLDKIEARARFAADCGAGALMVLPGLIGFDALRWLSQHPGIQLPLLSHPAFLGANVVTDDCGMAHGVLFGTMQRLAGADISIFPNVGGRFGFSAADCLSIRHACQVKALPQLSIFPAPGGGMTPDRVPEMRQMYGDDVVYLLGGSLLRYKERMVEAIHTIRAAIDLGAKPVC